jgi:hypothetical protein
VSPDRLHLQIRCRGTTASQQRYAPDNQESTTKMAEQKNEGEGNHTAAREYNKAQQDFAKSGKVDQAAKDAARAVDGPEAADLKKAEAIGKSHAHGEDPQLKK